MEALAEIPDDDHELFRHPRLALLLDLDGTVIPFAATPEAAVLDRETIELVEALQRSGVQIMFVSGRPRSLVAPLRELLPRSCWVAEHGSWRCDETGEWLGAREAPELGELVASFQRFTMVPGVRLETKSLSLCIHWRLVPQVLKRELIASVELACKVWLASHVEFERLDGVELLEIRRRGYNKSRAVEWMRERDPAARIVAIGDDHTDEDMFGALRADELAIGVGNRPTRARYRLSGPPGVRAWLRWLAETVRSAT